MIQLRKFCDPAEEVLGLFCGNLNVAGNMSEGEIWKDSDSWVINVRRQIRLTVGFHVEWRKVKIDRKAKWWKEWERVELKGVRNAKRDNTGVGEPSTDSDSATCHLFILWWGIIVIGSPFGLNSLRSSISSQVC